MSAGEPRKRPGRGKNAAMADVRLVDLDVIKRYSLAVRQESAPAEDVLAALDASREAVLAAMGSPGAPRQSKRSRRAPLKAQ
jgi:hypothetical protein